MYQDLGEQVILPNLPWIIGGGDRLETLERIATDQPSRLARDIDALAIGKGGNA